jgi:hypothetical protein
MPGFLLTAAIGVTAIPGCSSTPGVGGVDQSCAGLDTKSSAQLTVKGFAEAAAALNTKAADVEAKFLAVCNKMNADLGEDTTKTTAADACGVLNARVKKGRFQLHG